MNETHESACSREACSNPVLEFTYRNWRGEISNRRVRPLTFVFGATSWNPEPQWLLTAVDLDKGEMRSFAWADIIPSALKADALIAERDAARAEVERLRAAIPSAWTSVLDERRRQVEVAGWTPEHDDSHIYQELAQAGAAYALASADLPDSALDVSPIGWELKLDGDERCMLVKAGALILAEIERLDRAALKGDLA